MGRDRRREKLKEALRAGTGRDYAKAARILENLIAAWDAPPEAYLYLGRSYHALGDYSGALAAFGEFIRLRPNSPPGYFFAGRAYLALGMNQQAIPFLEDSLKHDPGNIFALALLGTACLKARRSRAAVNILRQAVEAGVFREKLSPAGQRRVYRAYLNALFIRGIKLCRAGDYDLGIQTLNFVLENGREEVKNIPLIHLELGRACRETGRLAEAAAHYTEALHCTPGDTHIRWYRASILMALGRDGEALEDLEIIRSAGGGEAGNIPENLPWNGELVDRFMIRSFLDKGEWRQAADAARTWLKTRRPDPAIHAMYAEAQRNLGNYESALNHLNRAAELAGGEVRIWYAMLMTSREAGDWKTLRKALRKVKELSGDGDIIRRFTVLLEVKTSLPAGDTTEAQDRQAVELLQKAIRILGPEEDIMFLLGERCLKLGLLEAAVTWFTKTAEINPGHERAFLGIIAAWEGLLRDGETGADGKLLAAYHSYLEHWDDNRGIRRELAMLLVHREDFRQAAGELEILLPWETENPTLRRLLAYCYRKTGRYREAAFYLKGLLKEKPDDTELLLEYTGCLTRAGAAGYAVLVLEKALALFNNLPFEVILSLGDLLYKEKKIERAFDIFREAAAKSGKDPRPYRRMAGMARELGDTEGARRYDREAERREKG
ncbi:MAG: tetratricopeptide repeat protein [Treponema sp.]|nr:tetratricopeptide repeat protein [Treponema sp.]